MMNQLIERSEAPGLAPPPALLALSPIIQNAVTAVMPLLERREQAVALAIDETTLLVDEQRLEQIVVNLLTNAAKYSTPRDTISIRTTLAETHVSIEIEDHGPGIPESDRRRIFDRFYRSEGAAADAPGLGLGLAIVRDIVVGWGGHVGVDDVKPHGALFWFTIPRA